MIRWHLRCFFLVAVVIFTNGRCRCLLSALKEDAEVLLSARSGKGTSSKNLLTSTDLLVFKNRSAGTTTRRPSSSMANKVITLPILALLDLSPVQGSKGQRINGSSLLKTAQKAVRDVNRRQIIPGHHLQLLVNDSKVHFFKSLKLLF